ncbi:MAG TPA: AAA family ATPase [Candidatus Cybelea sp.]|jgi:DNA polymerase III delta prime subunit|nr:AAA family ATPase [Candidatus Cybelea sp.]
MTQFIGKTGLIQKVLIHKLTRLRSEILAGKNVSVLERRVLFTGPPGVGKTALGKELADFIAGDAMAVEKLNGSNVNVDKVRDWTANACYKPLFGEISVKFVDEIDAIKTDALNDIRTYLDELAPHRLFIACTNKKVDDLQEQLQSRFQVWRFEPVPREEIAAHLVAKFHLPTDVAADIALQVKGNVRAAEIDAIAQLDVQAALAAAA